jgi:outer membrane murein-binding lipoprotein Lpp
MKTVLLAALVLASLALSGCIIVFEQPRDPKAAVATPTAKTKPAPDSQSK